ncbi:26S proteasome non-ATPase regulatory subunit 13 isoform 2 [Schistosoma japonicum]|uniref:26S proteasome non-ATPase regulatory subunit 13 n=4 Tax=Schistosoma japonicum TaxID=6182 RepID=C1LJW5_SCHJA|nr:26S proteasome non-ATPase regulatory subunit 13 [Schistosoma japonicum]TNN05795.1 26S proteasome non-ATPase regulatory subunit 13 isoform 2 [Schistosoma japonicum]CAX74992.1 26S proteasome regulatory subunit N1 [Schistosoma japonicum]CAX74993.1 26S proteasome regulatory subunit N1 [Schistosoma japonicum]
MKREWSVASLTVRDYLNDRICEAGSFQDDWTQVSDFHTKKLWHQLTLKLESLLKNPEFRSKTDLILLSNKFLGDFIYKINPLSLAELCVPISEQYVITDPRQGIKFLEEVRDEFTSKSKEAKILFNTTIGMIYLTALNDLPSARQVIETTESQLDEIEGVTTVHSRFYQLSSRYYQIMGQHTQFYQEALRFLGCVDLDDLSVEEQKSWAFSVGLAAVLGEGVYSFGELLTHDILKSLQGSPEAWLIDLLQAFNRGDLNQLDQLRSRWCVQADLVAAEPKLRDKVTLLCLVEMIFRRPTNKRTLTFVEISSTTRVPIDQVEHFLMKALSLKLIKGRIDEVNQCVSLTWLQPRVLDKEQIGSMCTRLNEWSVAVEGMKNLVEVDTKSILT